MQVDGFQGQCMPKQSDTMHVHPIFLVHILDEMKTVCVISPAPYKTVIWCRMTALNAL